MYIKLTEEQRKNIMIFLDRTTIKGSEVVAFAQILKALQNPVELEKDGDK